ncbi:MAG: TonB-dependent receptor [Saprospiraceae bacterium]|nr:TonB-dependent receptor [Saprospiraceae bacterium]
MGKIHTFGKLGIKFFYWIGCFLLLNNTVFAQTLIRGSIRDKSSSEPIIGAWIRFLDQPENEGSLSDLDGNFSIKTKLTGRQNLEVKYTGYETHLQMIDLDENSQIQLDIKLSETNILLQTLVISSSRSEKPISESTISLDIIRPEYPEKLNATSVQQVLDRIPGVQMLDGQANIRGGSGYSYGAGSRVMVVMDDLPVLQPDAGLSNWDDLPLENAGQIEVVKGAASSLYGSAAMNGIIHFRSIKPTTEPYTSLTIMPRFFMTPDANNHWWGKDNRVVPGEMVTTLVHRKRYHKTNVSLGAFYANKTGYNQGADSENGRISGLITRHLSDRLIIGLGFNFNKGASSSFFYWKGEGLYTGDTSSYSNTQKLRFNVDPSLQYISTKNYKHRLLTRWFRIDNQVDNNQSNRSNNYYSEYQCQKSFERLGIQLTGGGLLYHSAVNAALYGDTTFRSYNLAGYVQAEKKWFDRWIISAGMRFEHYSIYGPNVIGNDTIENPSVESRPILRLGTNYRIARATYIRASWGQGFRFPTLAEKYISTVAGGINVSPNLNIEAESGESYEVGLKQGFSIGKINGFLDAAWFLSNYRDMLEFSAVFDQNFRTSFQSQNVGDTRIEGFEISCQSQIQWDKNTVQLSGGYTWLDPKFVDWDSTGKKLGPLSLGSATVAQRNAYNSTAHYNILKYRNRHLLRWDLEFQRSSWYIGCNFTYASHIESMDRLFEDILIPGLKSFRLKHDHGYRLFDFRCGYKWSKWSFQINLSNAFNEVYIVRPGLMEAPRNLSARVSRSW